ncbi:MAG TPA: hypothetical protein VD997_14570 [Phycisphaerales bacterium]|nr:hypothetical protein [Phycisphaerales bacterium]
MRRWALVGAAGCAGLLCTALPVLAGPLNRALVDRDASWLVHVDAEAAQRSSLHAFMLRRLDESDKAKLEECRKRFGITPADIKGLTVYGFSVAEDGVAVITTTGKADELAVKLPTAGLEDFKTRVEGAVHYFSFKHEGQTFHAAVRPSGAPDERLVLIAGTAGALEKGLKVAAGLAPSLSGEVQANNLLATAEPDRASIVFVVARDMANDPQAKANFLRNAKGVVVDIGETGEGAREVYANLTLTATNAKVAEELRQTCQGMIALGTMLARENKADGIVESLQGVKVVLDGDKLSVTGREKSDAVLTKLERFIVEMEKSEKGASIGIKRETRDAEEKDAPEAANTAKGATKEPVGSPAPKP